MPDHAEGVIALDSVIDGAGIDAIAGPSPMSCALPCTARERTTIRGATLVRQIDLATETMFDGLVEAERTQTGCVRFSYVPPLSRTPRRYRCQPDLADRKAIEAEETRVGPLTPAQKQAVRDLVHLRVKPEYTAEGSRPISSFAARASRNFHRRCRRLRDGRLLPSHSRSGKPICACGSRNTCRSGSITV
ncbi:MAG: hypothetical protein U1E67_12945 [Hyphomicrobiales bacterium]